MISGTMGVADFQCRQILGERYMRVDAVLPRGVEIDDARPRTIDWLIARAAAAPLDEALAWRARHDW